MPITLLVVYALMRWLIASPFGRVAVAIRENEQRVELMGYDIRFRKTVLFSVGGAIAGLAGTLFASWAEIVTPGMFSLAQSAEIIVWCIVGGLGTLTGPVIGAMILAFLKFLLGQQAQIDSTLDPRPDPGPVGAVPAARRGAVDRPAVAALRSHAPSPGRGDSGAPPSAEHSECLAWSRRAG